MKAKLYVLASALCVLMSGRLFAEGEGVAPVEPVDQSFWQTLVMIGVAFMFFYVILWRPEQKRKKALEEQRNGIQKGDRVVAMGIIGTVDTIEEDTVILKMIDGSRIKFFKAAITDTLPESDKEPK